MKKSNRIIRQNLNKVVIIKYKNLNEINSNQIIKKFKHKTISSN